MLHKTCANISVSPEFHEFIPAAIMRLKYIFPKVEIKRTENGLNIYGAGDSIVQRLEQEVTYQIYREKIFQQTLPMRRDLYHMLTM